MMKGFVLFLFLSINLVGCGRGEIIDPVDKLDYSPVNGLRGDTLQMKDCRDGQIYKVCVIGNDVWFSENANYNSTGSIDTPFNYGRHYDYETALSVCPKGWRLPSNTDFTKLFEKIAPSYEIATSAIKDLTSWTKNKGVGGSCFKAKATGFYYLPQNRFLSVGKKTAYWSSTKWDEGAMSAIYISDRIEFDRAGLDAGLNCRCILDK